nr:hypothetical protein [Tanacetum cinerariifolium]
MLDDDLVSLTGFDSQASTDHDTEEESNISKKVAEDMKSSVPAIVADTLKEQLLEEIPQVDAQIQKNLQAQLPDLLLKPIYKEFNAFNKLESQRFVLLQKELSKFLHNKIRKSIRLRVRTGMKEEEQPSAQIVTYVEQAPHVNKENALVLYTVEKRSLKEDTSGKKKNDAEPPAKKLKFLIPSLTPLKTLMPDPPQYTKAVKMTLAQFTEYLSNTTSSILSPTPPRELTPPKDESKRKEGLLSQEDVMSHLKEMKRLADLKAKKEKSEESLKKLLKNSAIIRAQKQKMVEHEAKRQKIAKFEWVLTQAKALGIPSPPELSTFRLSVLAVDKKRKRSSEILEEVFVKENVVVDGMHRNLVPPTGLKGDKGLSSGNPSPRFSSTTRIGT